MKNLKLVIMALFVTLSFSSCSNDDDGGDSTSIVLTENETPVAIQTYVTTHFPSRIIDLATQTTTNGVVTYEILLSGNTNLVFSDSYDVLEISSMDQLPNSVIPQSILDYVAEHYPDNYITEWELEDDYQEVELDNDLELEFTLDGVFIRVDHDDDDDEILAIADIPSAITEYISTHFSSSTIIGAWMDNDDDETTYEINLDGDIELEFNSQFEIISIESDSQLPDSVIPQAILDYVAEYYPDNYITEWELEDNYQEVELDNDIELEFTLDGVFIRVDSDDDEDDDDVLALDEIPSAITDYISTHFPSNSVIAAWIDNEDDGVEYEIKLSGDIDLKFDSQFQVLKIESDTQLPDSVIPEAILAYVSENYPSNYITEWELDSNEQKVELDNDTELTFTLDGVFVSADND